MEVGTREDLLNKRYPAKLLLFGEHLVLDGASCLAIPFDKHFAFWTKGKSLEPLDDFYDYLGSLAFINPDKLKTLEESGYYLKSNIPRGYGLGSSGALCAAVYEVVVDSIPDKQRTEVINELSIIESFFHGKSSGLDAYVILMNQSITLKVGMPKHVDIDLKSLPFNVYLIDSGQSRNSIDLINQFINQESYREIKKKLIGANDNLVKDVSNGDFRNFNSQIRMISEYQYELLNYAVVESIKPLWKEGLETNKFTIKLCGAGGGGFYLGFDSDGCLDQYDFEKVLIN